MHFMGRLTFLVATFLLLASSFRLILPTSGHRETIAFDPSINNQQLTAKVLKVLDENAIAPCNGANNIGQNRNETLKNCTFKWWHGDLTSVDENLAEITVGPFPTYAARTIGHSANIRRRGSDQLEITVKGVFAYYLEIPNDDVARQLANIISENL